MRAGLKLAAARGVTAVHDKDGGLGALGLWQRLEPSRRADAARLAVGARTTGSTQLRALGIRSGLRQPAAAARLPEGVHGRDARLADGAGCSTAPASGSRAARSSPRSCARRGRGRVPGRGARDRRPREPRGARRVRGDARRRGRRSGCASGSSTRSCSRRRTSAAVRGSSASRRRCSSRTRRPTAISPTATGPGKTDGAYAYRSLLDSGAVVANGSDAPIEELDPLAGIRAGVRRTIDEREAWHPEQALTVQQAFEATCARAGLARGRRAPARPAAARATPPTSSCSTATRGTTSTRRSWRRWSPAGGCTTRRRGTDAGDRVGAGHGRVRTARAIARERRPHPGG